MTFYFDVPLACLREAADGIRTHDLLHGKQIRRPTSTEPHLAEPAPPSPNAGHRLSVALAWFESARTRLVPADHLDHNQAPPVCRVRRSASEPAQAAMALRSEVTAGNGAGRCHLPCLYLGGGR